MSSFCSYCLHSVFAVCPVSGTHIWSALFFSFLPLEVWNYRGSFSVGECFPSGSLVGEGEVSKSFFLECDALGGFGSLEEERFFREEGFWLAGRVSLSEEEKGKESA